MAAGTRTTATDPTSADGILRLVFQLQAVTYGVVGLIFLVFPNGTVRSINALGSWFRVFAAAPESDLRFWLSLGVSYMALVTLLAAVIQRNPRQYRHMMPILAAGKFCSSFTCLLFFVLSSPTFLYLLNFLVDGSISVLVAACYVWTGLLEVPSEASTRTTDPILDAIIDTLLPVGGVFAIGGLGTPLAGDLKTYAEQVHARGPIGLVCVLYLLEYGPLVLGPRRVRFTRLSAAERERYIAGFERSRFAVRRQLLVGLKLIAMLHFYGYPEAQRAVGYDGSYLRDKLLAGPNAAAHGARLQGQ